MGVKRCPMRGAITWWLRQLNPDTQEGSITNVMNTIRAFGGDGIVPVGLTPKVADGTRYQGMFDSNYPVNSLQDVLVLRDLVSSLWGQFTPVAVARGFANEPAFIGAIAKAVGSLMIDFEPYSGFYDQATLSTIPAYCKALRQASGDAYLMIQPDPRQFGLQGISFPQIAQYFDGICAQHYVGWSAVGWTNVDAEVQSFNNLAQYGAEMYATLYGVDRTDLALQFAQRISAQCSGFNMFAFGSMGPADFARFRGQLDPGVAPDAPPVPPQPPTPPTPDGETVKSIVADIQDELQQILELAGDR